MRKDAREARERHEKLRALLPDLEMLWVQADDAAAKADAQATVADGEEAVAAKAKAMAATAESAFAALDRVRQEYDGLVLEGKAARHSLNSATSTVQQLEAELVDLDVAAGQLAQAAPGIEDLAAVESEVALLAAVVGADAAVSAIAVGPEPAPADEASLDEAQQRAEAARSRLAGVSGQLDAVRAELVRAQQQAERSIGLSGEAACPLCGQALGDAFEQVRSHRAAEVTEAQSRLEDLQEQGREAATVAKRVATDLGALAARVKQDQQARTAWERAQARRADAEAGLDRAQRALVAAHPPWASLLSSDASASLAGELERLRDEVDAKRTAAALVQRLRGRLERRPIVVDLLERAREQVAENDHRLTTLLDKVKALGFHPDQLVAAQTARDEAVAAAERAERVAQVARLAAERERTVAEGEARRLADGEAQHAQLSELAADATHLGRAAELLSSFRNTVVATVGPRLAVQAAELFGELTDHEYDRLEVDPETYELQVRDGGRLFGMDRLSGSEIDLANLALRVAISEHVRFQSGGSVGLLVLDEIFGPLDEDRKARMLLALERLRGRFRQILVVTHDQGIKEQLPNAVEVIKQPGRRATARLLNA